jgi:putative ABC transport system substrate-binding protein
MTDRRALLIALGASALTLPVACFGQAKERVWRIGFLTPDSQPALIDSGVYGSFSQSMRELGYVTGKNLAIEWRFANRNADRLNEMAADLVRIHSDVIVAVQTPAVRAAKQATNSIPIVMAPAGDPVGLGLVASLARPGGNVTGVSNTAAELAAKSVELIREMLPTATRVAVLAYIGNPFTKSFLEQIDHAGVALGINVHPLMVRGEGEFDAAFKEMGKLQVNAVVVQPILPRKRAIELALKHRLPAVSTSRVFAEEGGLMSYAGNFADMYHGVAVYVDKIIRGARPADLPVEQPTKFELVINMKTAKALGIKIPNSILVRAEKVIT